ncbi:MAG: UDP-N-acetylmuramate dehydrogenase [Campylobacteraceae bacterium]|jgi:UDP-N-acetylmuramate dehydrogenase|nr:UDP-N-acetylmuramate dehydrogenase [Campylobacteraceae bacterium]MBT3881724.1 UDP-N-acetylmuramate dehydrogenase [Campylobacteraceae bacterium]MBT4179336.1 UDP-N-acetylmuramate dehydrogenase [Campylobacteraceae bacterium]MBT4573104.1 UDP-N-acetylmuramate dehydrogenase [Campylobacteraceae bacterium]MBT5324000.1 UDP-N-acetylmuramate dehydrogenase [Campylobacteraceae bacterium]
MTKVIDFKKYTSIHIGGKHSVKVINEIGDFKKYTILGRGNNLLISNNPKPLAILGEEFDYILQKNRKLIVGAAVSSGKLLTYCKKNNIANFELLAKLPGNMGGLVKMNAGLKQWEIFNHLHSIKTQNGDILKENIPHTYRHTQIDGIIYEITFDIESGYCKDQQKTFNTMRDNQPSLPSAGSCFKNPKDTHSAGYMIEKAGLKGYTIGGMAFSSEHANFLVNMGDGTYDEAIKLIKLAKQKVLEQFNINLELEIIII